MSERIPDQATAETATHEAALPPETCSRWVSLYAEIRVKLKDPEGLRKRLDYPTYLLATAGLVASLVLGLGDLSTKGSIRERQREDLLATLAQVIPDDIHDNDLLDDVIDVEDEVPGGLGRTEVYLARQGQKVSGVAFQMVALGGYSGPITLVVGLDKTGELLGVRVVAHTETPGLGDKIEASKSDWIRAFVGRSLENTLPEHWRVKKDGGDFDQFAGATITPRAVVSGIGRGLEFFRRHRSTLIGLESS